MNALRVPPHSVDAEQAVLGGLMLDERAWERVADKLNEEDFYRKDHRLIFRAIGELSAKNQPVDAVTMGEWFDANGLAEAVGGSNYILQLANNTPGAANILGHARIVREKATLRQIIDVATELGADGFNPEGREAQEVIDAAIVRLMAMQRDDRNVEYTARQAAKKAYETLAAAHLNGGALNTVPTGINDLDRMLGGLHPGDLIVVGARAAMGKTAFLANAALHAASNAFPVGVISGEQPADQMAARMMALAGNVRATKFRTGQFEEHEWPRVTDALGKVAASLMWFLDRSSPSIVEVQRVARRWKKQHGIRALYVDYLQRLQAPGERRWESVGAAAKGLKDMARDLEIPVVVLAQVSRQVETGGKGRQPRLGDLSDSSEIEKEADQVLMLYREGYYDIKANQNVATITVEKNRHGPTGFVEVAWIGETMRFADLYGGNAA